MGIYDMMMDTNRSFQEGQQRGQQRRLGQLYSSALTAPQAQRPDLLAQMAKVSPDAAVSAQKTLADGDETAIKSTMQALSMATAAWKAGNKEMAQGFYSQAAPHLASLAGGKPLPPQMDDAAAQAFEKIIANASGGAAPQGFREFQMTAAAAGLVPGTPEYQQAANIALGRSPRAVTGAMKFDTFTGADGRPRPQRNNPTSGGVEIYYDESGQWMPLGAGGGSQQQLQGQPQGQPAMTQVEYATSDGMPIDPSEQGVAAEAFRRSRAGEEFNIPVTGGGQQSRVPGLGVGRRAEDEAYAKEAAQQRAQTEFLPQRGAIEARNAGQKETATQAAQVAAAGPKAQAEARAKAVADWPAVKQAATTLTSTIDELLKHPGLDIATGLSSKLDPRNFVPGQPGYDFRAKLEQLKGQTFLQAFNSLRGGGQITEVEGKKATDAIAALDNAQSRAQFVAALKKLQSVGVNAMNVQVQRMGGKSGGQQSAQQRRYAVGDYVEHGGKRYRVTGGDPQDPDVEEVR